MKRYLLGVLMSLLAVGSLSAQEWTAEDSLRVQEMLHGDREIHVTPDLMRDLRDAFRSDPQADVTGTPSADARLRWTKTLGGATPSTR